MHFWWVNRLDCAEHTNTGTKRAYERRQNQIGAPDLNICYPLWLFNEQWEPMNVCVSATSVANSVFTCSYWKSLPMTSGALIFLVLLWNSKNLWVQTSFCWVRSYFQQKHGNYTVRPKDRKRQGSMIFQWVFFAFIRRFYVYSIPFAGVTFVSGAVIN